MPYQVIKTHAACCCCVSSPERLTATNCALPPRVMYAYRQQQTLFGLPVQRPEDRQLHVVSTTATDASDPGGS
jgi:hypothetical protein